MIYFVTQAMFFEDLCMYCVLFFEGPTILHCSVCLGEIVLLGSCCAYFSVIWCNPIHYVFTMWLTLLPQYTANVYSVKTLIKKNTSEMQKSP